MTLLNVASRELRSTFARKFILHVSSKKAACVVLSIKLSYFLHGLIILVVVGVTTRSWDSQIRSIIGLVSPLAIFSM